MAVGEDLAVLDLAAVHHDVLATLLREQPSQDPVVLVTAAGDVFQESLSAFEMVRRGYREARDTVRLQRRQADMVRQLSSFLADASLALGAPDSLEEMLRLVAEEARELVGATCCVMSMQRSTSGDVVRAVTCEGARDLGWASLAEALEAEAPATGGAVLWQLDEDDLRSHPALGDAGGTHVPRGWRAAPLTALDGRKLGSIHIFDKGAGAFSDVDEAVVVNLAQMASAAVERALLYRERGR